MGGVIFSVTLSVSLAAALLFLLKGTIVRRYGFKMIYILSLIMAIRLIIPYSIQLPDAPLFSIVIPFYVPIIWVVGAIICLLFQVGKYIYLKKKILGNSNCVTDETLLRQYESVKSGLFIDDEIPLLQSAEVNSPMLLGFFKPCIVLPMHSFSENETEMVLRHELMHYRNKDSLKKLFFAFVTAVQWFNPFAWLIMRQFYGSLECMCDEAVTKNSDRQYKKNYCYMLLKTGEQSRNLTTAATYFSTKEMLKMRIDSVFEGKKKKSGTALITSFVVCLTVLSGFLCSCTVETPDDVKEEMSRVESGVENEKEVDESATEEVTEGSGLMPVSEVVSTAQQTIDEWNSKDGIFKFDNCNVMIPQVTEFPEYEMFFDAGLTPQKKYEQFKFMEKELFGENYFNEDELRIDPGTYMGDGYVPLEEFLEMDSPYGIIANWDDTGTIENQISVNWYRLASYRNLEYNEEEFIKEYNCFEITDEELAEEWELLDGTVTVSEAIKTAEETMEKYKFSADENVNHRLRFVRIHSIDEKNVISFKFQIYYNDIPFMALTKAYDETDEIKITGMGYDETDMVMCEVGSISSMHAMGTNLALTPTGNSYEEILSLEQVFGFVKDKISNRIVYDVESISLGASGNNPSGDVYVDGTKTYPLYNMLLNSGEYRLHISIDALTGDINIWKQRIVKDW